MSTYLLALLALFAQVGDGSTYNVRGEAEFDAKGDPIYRGVAISAEDEAIIAMLLEDIIDRCGGTVVAMAKSCAEVFEALGMHAINAIILDVHLQGGSSEEVVAVAADKNIAVLVCTGSAPHTLSPAFRNLPVLKKPWQGDDVDRALAQLFAEAG